MGLDIEAYEKLKLIRECGVREFTHDDQTQVGIYAEKHFVLSTDGMPGGMYRIGGRRVRFHAGTHGHYNSWRAKLAEFIGTSDKAVWRDPKPGPFVELINNSDCEGFIGTTTAAKLAKDFADWQERVDALPPFPGEFDDRYSFRSLYRSFREAFELAANGGVLKFFG